MMEGRRPPKKYSNYGVTTFGNPIISHIDAINKEYDRYMFVTQKIHDYLVDPVEFQQDAESWKDKAFLFLTFVPYCQSSADELMPAEFSFAVFSYASGIIAGKTSLFDTGSVPYGQHFEVKSACEDNALPFPGRFQEERIQGTDPVTFFAHLKSFADEHGLFYQDTDEDEKSILIFTTKAEASVLNGCLKWLHSQMEKRNEVPPKTTVLNFETLIKGMSRMEENTSDTEGVIVHEGGAARFIYDTRYDFNLFIACKWHQRDDNAGKICACANSITLRRIYNALYYLAHLYEGGPKPPAHVPPDMK